VSRDWAPFQFGPLNLDVTIHENHPEYRVWTVKFWRGGQHRLMGKAAFHMEKGIWFGWTAYDVLALMVAEDLAMLFYDGKRQPQPDAPVPVDRKAYEKTLEEVSESFDFKKDVPEIYKAIQFHESMVDEDGEDQSSIHNALALFRLHGIPSSVEIRVGPYGIPYLQADWDSSQKNPERKFTFHGLRVGPVIVSASPINEFFRMIGYYRTEQELRGLKHALDQRMDTHRRGPKEWSPLKWQFMLFRGKDYGLEDLQRGEPAL